MATLDLKSSSDTLATTSDAAEHNMAKTSATVDQAPTATSVDNGPVQAYAKLEGQHFCYYIRTLQVTLGRKVNRLDKADKVDIPLGNTKSVSRQHARLFYNFTTQRFELMVIGKNGAFVNDQFIERGMTIPLENRTKITIGETHFIFLLPYMDADDGNSNNGRSETGGYISTPQQIEKQRKRKTPQQTSSLPTANSNQVDDEEEDEVDEEFKKTMIGYPGVPNPYLGKEDKPPFSYANLIAQAINNASTDKRMTLNEIYTYLSTAYPYFKKGSSTGWQNSIRHNLSLNKAFIKLPRSNNDSGKGAFWTIDPKLEYSIFATNVPMKQRNSKRGSAVSSPATSSKDGDDDNSSANIVTTGPPSKKQRKDKATKDSDDGKGRKDQAATTVLPGSDPAENTSTSTITATSSSVTTTTTHGTTEAAESETISEDSKTNKSKQRKSSKSKVSVSPSSPSSASMTSTNDALNTMAATSIPSTSASTLALPLTTGTSAGDVSGQEVSTTLAKTSADPSSTMHSQAQLQLQLQNTIRQHLLDPIRNPLPPTIAQLLPQAIAQLPPQIANQLSSTLNVALRAQQQHQLQQQQQQQQQQNQQQQQQQNQQQQQQVTENTTDTQSTGASESTTTVAPLPSASAHTKEDSTVSELGTSEDKKIDTSTTTTNAT